MKKLLSGLLCILMLTGCVFCASCGGAEASETNVARSFIAGYENIVNMGGGSTTMNGRVLLNLLKDGTLEAYVGLDAMGSVQTAKYTGTYTIGENEEFDETISFSYSCGEETAEATDLIIIDGVFETPFHMIMSMTSNKLKFYETAPARVDGNVYVGYLTKSSGMGDMVYAYALNLKDDGKFDVSITQMAAVMHVWGYQYGKYTVNGSDASFTYDVTDGEGGIVAKNYVSNGTELTENGLMAGFNIAQNTMAAAPAVFIRVK